jgi:peptidoglycan/xylan/chitin deacetylase (PgdA/CDA1 family)
MSLPNISPGARLFSQFLACSGVQRCLERRATGGVIVAYHGVVERARDPLLDLYNIDLNTFAAHLRFFRRYCKVVPVRRIVERLGRGEPIPADWVAITMDDALRSQVTLAAEVLRTHGCPWTLAVPAGLIGTERTVWTYEFRFLLLRCWRLASVPSPVDPTTSVPTGSEAQKREAARHIHALLMSAVDDRRREQYLDRLIDWCDRGKFFERVRADGRFVLADWEQLRRLQGEGVEMASHGWTHRPHNETLTPDSRVEEILGSRQRMADELGCPPIGFVLPGGQSAQETGDVLRQAGYEYCLASESRRIRVGEAVMRIPRFDAEYPLPVLRRHLLRPCR